MAKNNSPIGTSVEAHNEQRRARGRKFQETQDRAPPSRLSPALRAANTAAEPTPCAASPKLSMATP